MVVSQPHSHTAPLVSVIVPNYNHAKYLHKRINSILNQTFQDFELIILDDKSQDESRDIISQFALQDNRIRTYFNEVNSGSPFKQWNKGVQLTRGEYIWIAESDDYAEEDFLSTLLPVLQAHKKVGVAYCQSWIVDEEDSVMGNMEYWTKDLNPDRWEKNYVNYGIDECTNYLVKKPTIPNASAVLFKKQTYYKAGMADENYVMCGDWLMWIKMLLNADIYFVAQSLNYFRLHPQTTRNINNHDKVLIKIREEYKIFQFITKNVTFEKATLERLKQYIFHRSIEFCPASLKFSFKFLDFIRIVREVDRKVYWRLSVFILKRLFTYIPEKINNKIKYAWAKQVIL